MSGTQYQPDAELNAEQKRAIAQLKRALTALDKAGVCLTGMDNTLYAYPREPLEDARARTGSWFDAQQVVGGESIPHPAYVESGAW